MTLDNYSTERLEQITGSLWQVATARMYFLPLNSKISARSISSMEMIDDDKHNAAEESEAWRELDQLSADLCDAYRIIFALMQERSAAN